MVIWCDNIGLVSLILLGWELRVLYHCTMCTRHPDLVSFAFYAIPTFHIIIFILCSCPMKRVIPILSLLLFIHYSLSKLQVFSFTCTCIKFRLPPCQLHAHTCPVYNVLLKAVVVFQEFSMTLFIGSQSFISPPSFMFVSAADSEIRELNRNKKKNSEIGYFQFSTSWTYNSPIF